MYIILEEPRACAPTIRHKHYEIFVFQIFTIGKYSPFLDATRCDCAASILLFRQGLFFNLEESCKSVELP